MQRPVCYSALCNIFYCRVLLIFLNRLFSLEFQRFCIRFRKCAMFLGVDFPKCAMFLGVVFRKCAALLCLFNF